MSSFSDLNGLWTGSYSYPAAGMTAVAFTAWLDAQAGAIGGTILEPNTFANTPADDLSATISGTRTGSELTFTKVYDPGQSAHAQPIHYVARINRDFTWITGRWRIPGQIEWSGPFEMSRQSGALESVERTREVELIE